MGCGASKAANSADLSTEEVQPISCSITQIRDIAPPEVADTGEKAQSCIEDVDRCHRIGEKGKHSIRGSTSSGSPMTISDCFNNYRIAQKCSRGKFSQKDIDDALLHWIVDAAQPFCEVDRSSFKHLWEMLIPDRNLMCSKALLIKINHNYDKMENSIISHLDSVSVVCTTADCWTSFRKSFIGVTCHWIDEINLERNSAVLACHRLMGRHTHDVIAEELSKVFKKFGIQNKIAGTITDNSSNFVKAFKMFSKISNIPEEEEIQGIELDDLLSSENCQLPPHRRCAAHILNLVATKNADIALQEPYYRSIYSNTFRKCQNFWKKCHHSTPFSDYVQHNLGGSIRVPNSTRWNSTYDAIERICKLLKSKEVEVHKAFDYAELSRLTQEEITFLMEFKNVMEPLASALDLLQGDSASVGYLIPTLRQLIQSYSSFKDLKFCHPLAKALGNGVKKRFASVLVEENLLLASAFNPLFKVAWMEEDEKRSAKQNMEKYFKTFLNVPSLEKTNSEEIHKNPESTSFNKFFSFKKKIKVEETSCCEVTKYLASGPTEDVNVLCLAGFEIIKKCFIKSNTVLCSSAPAERLFSSVASVLTSKRARTGDKNFEKQLLLKLNSKFW